jgi:hypothetical protein
MLKVESAATTTAPQAAASDVLHSAFIDRGPFRRFTGLSFVRSLFHSFHCALVHESHKPDARDSISTTEMRCVRCI